MKTRSFVLVASAVAIGTLGMSGCGSTNTRQTGIGHLRNNLTPELQTLGWRHAEVNNHMATARNQHFRALNEDLGRVLLYVDRPTRLTPSPVGY